MPIRNLRAKLAKSPLRRPLIWLRHRGLSANDIFLASYPRSGNTWLRFVLSEALTGQSIDFDNVDHFVPELKWHRGAAPILAGQGRLIKTHEAWRKEYRKAIYIVRDVRDVALSTYARTKQLGIVDSQLDDYLRSILQGRAHQYGAWHNHVRSWLDGPLARTEAEAPPPPTPTSVADKTRESPPRMPALLIRTLSPYRPGSPGSAKPPVTRSTPK